MAENLLELLKEMGIIPEINKQENIPITRNKGEKITTFPDDYTIIDLETTGLSSQYDSIIEVGAIKIRNNQIAGTYQQLINPGFEISDFITDLTGISNEMLEGMPLIEEKIDEVIDFISDDIVVGHNVNFDINFIYDNLYRIKNKEFSNPYIDTMRFSRKLHKELKHHRLADMADLYNIEDNNAHRALGDCYTTLSLFENLKATALEQFETFEDFSNSFKKKYNQHLKQDYSKLQSETTDFDESHIFYNKHCVFTGTLRLLTRLEAAQLVVNHGGFTDNSVTKKTNFLILGNNDYCSSIKGGKSTKQKRAEELISQGYDLSIIPEDIFYDLIF